MSKNVAKMAKKRQVKTITRIFLTMAVFWMSFFGVYIQIVEITY